MIHFDNETFRELCASALQTGSVLDAFAKTCEAGEPSAELLAVVHQKLVEVTRTLRAAWEASDDEMGRPHPKVC